MLDRISDGLMAESYRYARAFYDEEDDAGPAAFERNRQAIIDVIALAYRDGTVAAQQSEAALRAAALRMRDRPHVVQVREDGWGIQHPLGCRPALTECAVHRAVMQWGGPPVPAGEYEVGPLGEIVGPYNEPDPVLDFLAALADPSKPNA